MPHSSHLSLVTLFSLHFMAAIPNAGPFVEWSIEEDANAGEGLYSPSLEVKGGKVKIPDGPGWGVKVNPAWLEKAAYLKSDQQKEALKLGRREDRHGHRSWGRVRLPPVVLSRRLRPKPPPPASIPRRSLPRFPAAVRDSAMVSPNVRRVAYVKPSAAGSRSSSTAARRSPTGRSPDDGLQPGRQSSSGLRRSPPAGSVVCRA